MISGHGLTSQRLFINLKRYLVRRVKRKENIRDIRYKRNFLLQRFLPLTFYCKCLLYLV